jgi:hypothetical protein
VCAWRSIIEPLSLSLFFFTVRASSPKLLGACYEKHTETNEKRERERETRRNRKSRDRAPADFSLLRLVVGCGPLSPLFVSDITQQQLTNFLIILTEACKTTKVGLVETFWSSVDLSSHYYCQSVGGEHWTTLSPYHHSGLFSFKKTQGNWSNKRGSNRIQTTLQTNNPGKD